MQMHAFSISLEWPFPHPHSLPRLPFLFPQVASATSIILPSISSLPATRIINSRSIGAEKPTAPSSQLFHASIPKIDSTTLFCGADNALDGVDSGVGDNGSEDVDYDLSGGKEILSVYRSSGDDDDDDSEIAIENTGKNSRRIRSRIAIEASLPTVWNILTDYEKLADFIPGLAVSQLLERMGNSVRLFQIGQQKLAFGLNFNAKGIVDCYEKDLENLPFGYKREIEFKMIEGDFKLFEGKWSIEQYKVERCKDRDSSFNQQSRTILSYLVDVEPHLWLPVRLVEGRLCREIKVNLSCIRAEAQKMDLHYQS